MKQFNKIMKSNWVQVSDCSLRYRVPRKQSSADRPAVVMVHGLVVSSRYMVPTAVQLAPHCRVYLPELPGFGKSEKPDHYQDLDEMADTLAAWMNTVGLPRAILLGNSLGCQIIARFAVRHPERLQSVILAGPTMDVRARTARQEIGRWLLNALFEPPSLIPLIVRDYMDIGFRRFVATFRYGLQDQIETSLPQIKVPALVIRGSLDTIVPQAWAEHVTDLLPQGKLVVIDKAAHDVNHNMPGELARTVLAFLEEQSPLLSSP